MIDFGNWDGSGRNGSAIDQIVAPFRWISAALPFPAARKLNYLAQ